MKGIQMRARGGTGPVSQIRTMKDELARALPRPHYTPAVKYLDAQNYRTGIHGCSAGARPAHRRREKTDALLCLHRNRERLRRRLESVLQGNRCVATEDSRHRE